MPSTKPGKAESAAASKRAKLPRQSNFDDRFLKDWARYDKAGRVRMADIKAVMAQIIDNDGPLPPQYADHELQGRWAGTRECHVHGDLLLIYEIEVRAGVQTVVFIALGTHSGCLVVK